MHTGAAASATLSLRSYVFLRCSEDRCTIPPFVGQVHHTTGCLTNDRPRSSQTHQVQLQ
jgi:hypothetical protein